MRGENEEAEGGERGMKQELFPLSQREGGVSGKVGKVSQRGGEVSLKGEERREEDVTEATWHGVGQEV